MDFGDVTAVYGGSVVRQPAHVPANLWSLDSYHRTRLCEDLQATLYTFSGSVSLGWNCCLF